MKRSILLCALVALLSINFTILAQPASSDSPSAMGANFCAIKIFGTNNCTARCDVKIMNDSFKEFSTEGFALLDGKTRQEMDVSQFKAQMIPPAATRQMGIDQQIIILRPDLKLAYNIYPRLKSYVTRPLPKDDAAAQGKEPTLETTVLGREDVEGHPCVKNKFVITTGDGERHEILAWLASDLKNFPLKTQVADDGSIEVTTYKQIQFIKPDAKLFEPPAGFTEYPDFEEMMDKTQPKGIAELTDTNATYVKIDRLAPIVDFTLQKGTNWHVGPVTAKAFGLGDEKIPATLLILSGKEDALVHQFGVSARNTNDLFVARVDRNTRNGIVWLTSRSGEIRATLLTSTNGPPTVVPNDSHVNEYVEEISMFLEFTTTPPSENTAATPPWEDAPHPLNVVAKFGEVPDVEKILKRDPTAINTQDDEGMTPLAGAVVQEQVDVVRFLLDNGADPNIPNKHGLTPLEHACGRDRTNALALAKLLLAKGALVNATNVAGFTIPPLEWAVSSDNTELVEFLLDHGADAKAKSDVGSTFLHTAADRGDLEIAKMLIAHGVDVNAKITGGTTPLHQAAWGGHEALMELLLSKGAEADAKRSDGLTPLINAAGPGAERHGKGCVEMLLAKGANVNATDEYGETPLHKAAYYGNKDVVEILLAHGASINATNKNGKTPLKVASKPEIAELLRQHGARE
jgi:ankyrin repeat protein